MTISGASNTPATPIQPGYAKKAGYMAGSVVTKTISVPLYLLAQTPRAISVTAKVSTPVLQYAADAVSYVAQAGALTSRALKWSLLQAHKHGVLEKSSMVFRNMMETSVSRANDLKDAKTRRGNIAGTTAGYIAKKAIGMIPIAGDLTEMAIDGALEAKRVIEETDRYITTKAVSGAMWNIRGAADITRVAGPMIVKAGASVFETTENALEWIQDRSWQVYQGEGKGFSIAARATNIADIIESWSANLAHLFELETVLDSTVLEKPTITPKSGLDHFVGKKELWQNFIDLDKAGKVDLFFLVSTSKSCELTDTERKEFATAVSVCIRGDKLSDDQELSLKKLAGMFDLIPDDAVANRLTPSAFRAQSTLKQLQLYQIVREHATHLTPDEAAFLNKKVFRRMRTTHDWNNIDPLDKNLLEQLVVRLFNSLPTQNKELRYNITPAMYLELNLQQKQTLYTVLEQTVEKSGSRKDKSQFKEIANPPSDHRDIQILVNMFSKLLTKEQKYIQMQQLTGRFIVFSATPPELEILITDTQKQLDALQGTKNADKYVDTTEVSRLQNLLEALNLEKQEFINRTIQAPTTETIPANIPQKIEVTHPDIDIEQILEKIGPQVPSDANSGKKIGHAIGHLPRVAALLTGTPGWAVGTILGKICEKGINQYIGGTFQLSARVLELAMATQVGSTIVLNELMKLGVPLPEIERVLATAPNLVGKGIVQLQGLILKATQEAIDKSDSYAQTLLNIHEQLIMAESVNATEQVINTTAAPLEAARDLHIRDVLEYCSSTSNCSPEVYAVVSQENALDAFETLSGARFGSPEYLKAYQSLLEEGTIPGKLTTLESALETGKSLTEPSLSLAAAIPGAVAHGVYRPVRWLASWLVDPKAYESAFGHYYNAATENEVAQLLKRGTLSVASGISSGAKQIVATGKTALGLAKPLEGHMKENFILMATLGAQMHSAIKNKEAALSAIRGLDALRETYGGSLAIAIAKNDSVAAAVSFMKDIVNPTIRKVTYNLQAAHELAQGNQEFLNSHLDQLNKRESPVKLLLNDALNQLEQGADEKMQKDATWGKSLASAATYGGPIVTNVLKVAGYWYSGSMSNYYLTALAISTVLPSVLRTIGAAIKQDTSKFWYGLAEGSMASARSVGDTLQMQTASLGGYFKQLANYYSGKIDIERVKNFANLPLGQQEHLYELALQNTSNTKPLIEAHAICLVSAVNMQALATLILKTLDTLDDEALHQITPALFNAMDERVRQRISDIVEQYSGFEQDESALIQKFNKLSKEQKLEVDNLAVAEFRQLSVSDQKAICFKLAALEASRVFEEPSLEAFAPSIFYNPKAYALEHLKQYRKLQNASNQDLKALLPKLKDAKNADQEILGELLNMPNARLQHCYDIVKRYNAQGIYDLRDEKVGNLFLFENPSVALETRKKLLPQLAVLFNQLEPHQKEELLDLTGNEVAEFDIPTLKLLTTYLLSQPETIKSRDAVQKILAKIDIADVKLSEKEHTLLSNLFNTLKPEVKAEFHQKHTLGAETEKALFDNINGQMTKVKKEIELLQMRSQDLQSKEYMSQHHKETLLVTKKQGLLEKIKLIDRNLEALEKNAQSATNKKEIDDNNTAKSAIVAEIEKIDQKLKLQLAEVDVIIRGITHLEAKIAAKTCEHQALAKLLGRELEPEETILDNQTEANLEVGIVSTISIHNKIFVEGYTNKLEELDANNPDILERAKASTTKDIQNLTTIMQERAEETETLILETQKQISDLEKQIGKQEVAKASSLGVKDDNAEQTVKALIKARLGLQALTSFYRPLFKKLEEQNRVMLDDYLTKANLIMAKKEHSSSH
ncbi:MAG: hypothetical protein LLF94_11770 [Chlamydiales bacterium]|nr:hypothetical protein [Chlamydiales bacterium]